MLKRPNFEFSQAQAAFDLIWLLQSLEDAHLARVGGERFPTIVRDQSCRFESDADADCYATLMSSAIDAGDDAELAVAMIVANDLQLGLWCGDAKEAAEFALEPIRHRSRKLRSAILRGLDAFEERSYRHQPAEYLLPKESRLTRPIDQILPKLCAIARAMDLPTLKSVAGADYAYDTEKHLEALKEVLADDTCQFPENDNWYPSEVVELVSHVRDTPGFVPCTALLLANALQGKDQIGWFEFRWSNLSADYNMLPKSARAPILAGLRYLYESGEESFTCAGSKLCDPVTMPEGMIGYVEFSDDAD